MSHRLFLVLPVLLVLSPAAQSESVSTMIDWDRDLQPYGSNTEPLVGHWEAYYGCLDTCAETDFRDIDACDAAHAAGSEELQACIDQADEDYESCLQECGEPPNCQVITPNCETVARQIGVKVDVFDWVSVD